MNLDTSSENYLPPPDEREKKWATAPGLWTTLNLKGYKARYHWVIQALAYFMQWSHCSRAWSEQRVNKRARR